MKIGHSSSAYLKKLKSDLVIEAAMAQSPKAYRLINDTARERRKDLAFKLIDHLSELHGELTMSEQDTLQYLPTDVLSDPKVTLRVVKLCPYLRIPPSIQTPDFINAIGTFIYPNIDQRIRKERVDLALDLIDRAENGPLTNEVRRAIRSIPSEVFEKNPAMIERAFRLEPEIFFNLPGAFQTDELAIRTISFVSGQNLFDFPNNRSIPFVTKAIRVNPANLLTGRGIHFARYLGFVSEKHDFIIAKKNQTQKRVAAANVRSDGGWENVFNAKQKLVQDVQDIIYDASNYAEDQWGLDLNWSTLGKQALHYRSLPLRDKILVISYKYHGNEIINYVLQGSNNDGLKQMHLKLKTFFFMGDPPIQSLPAFPRASTLFAELSGES